MKTPIHYLFKHSSGSYNLACNSYSKRWADDQLVTYTKRIDAVSCKRCIARWKSKTEYWR